MNELRTQTRVDTEITAPELQFPDAGSIASIAVAEALSFCAEKMRLSDEQAAEEKLRQGDCAAIRYYQYSLARHVAEALGEFDQNVEAVYVGDYDATPEDQCFGPSSQISLIHLIVWTQQKSAALKSLAASLDRAFVEGCSQMLGTTGLTHLLDVQIIDNEEVENRVGYGALLSSLYNRPIQVWKRNA